jgi:hypothetical protein
MLMQNILKGYRDAAIGLVSVTPASTVTGHWPAANAGQYTSGVNNTRRLRRQRRAERHTRGRLGGWVVRTW